MAHAPGSNPPLTAGVPMLACRGLSKRFGSHVVLKDVDLSIAPGEILVLLGENGAGKTTLMRLLSGELLPDAGTIEIQGLDLHAQPRQARARLIYVSQRPPLAPLASLREHALALGEFRGLVADRLAAELAELAEMFSLTRAVDLPVRSLSGGMAHKAALTLALIAQAPLVLLDEPNTGLDVRSSLALRQRILAQRAAGTTFVLASHLAEATLAVADRAIVVARTGLARTFEREELLSFDGDARAFEHQVLQAM
jgi:ABC-2 type transport system ATP-binding protein